jgi:hypothetical protein
LVLVTSFCRPSDYFPAQVSIDADYPREHVTPELASLRNGSFQSPGMKRERAIIDSVGRAGHTTVTEMLEDVARRLNN